jgi:hypothetical protein
LDGKFAEDNIYVKPGASYEARAYTFDPDGDSLRLHWEVLPETQKKDGNSDKEIKPRPVAGVLQVTDQLRPVVIAPQKEGAYRLFVYIYDGQGNFSTANIPFYVRK